MALTPDGPLLTTEVACPGCSEMVPVPIRLSIADMFSDPQVDGAAIWVDTNPIRAHIATHRD